MSRKWQAKRSRKAGAPPGTLLHIGKHAGVDSQLRLVSYDAEQLQEQPVDGSLRLPKLDQGRVLWLNVDGVHQPELIGSLGRQLGLHPLVLEDLVNTDQRPKLEDYDGYLFLVLRMLQLDDQQQIQSEQLSLILAPGLLLSLQERPGDVFDGVRERLRNGRRIRFMHADYLAYALLDAVVDHYFVVLEQLGEQIELLEDELIERPSPEVLRRIHHYKREMLLLRKSVWPLREVLSRLSRDESPLISDETRLFLRDVYDHSIHVLDTIDTLRELLVGMLDLYLSSSSNRMNEVMKVLTIIATLFMPLTFIAGVYGMNFEHMPELGWRWGYPLVMLLMLGVSGGLLLAFRRRRWI